MRISVVVPHYEVNIGKRKLLLRFLESIGGQYDELIVIAEKRENLASKINEGLKKAGGEFIIVSNDDCRLLEGRLEDLCVENKVVTPRIIGSKDKLFHGHMWCFSRKTLEKIGYMWEGYDGFYYDDSDYWMQIEDRGIEIVKNDKVVVLHDHPASTLAFLHKDGREEKNREIFIKRWGVEALERIA